MSTLGGLTPMLMQGVQQSERARMALLGQSQLPQFGGGWPGAQLGMQLAQRKQQAQMQQQGANQRAMQQMLSRAMMQQQRLKQQAMVEKTRQAEAAQRSAMQQEGMALRREAGDRATQTHDLAITESKATADYRKREQEQWDIANRVNWTEEDWIRDKLRRLSLPYPTGELTDDHRQLGADWKRTWTGGKHVGDKAKPDASDLFTIGAAERVEGAAGEQSVKDNIAAIGREGVLLNNYPIGERLSAIETARGRGKTAAGGEEYIRLLTTEDPYQAKIEIKTEEELKEVLAIRKAAGLPESEWYAGLTGPIADAKRRQRAIDNALLQIERRQTERLAKEPPIYP